MAHQISIYDKQKQEFTKKRLSLQFLNRCGFLLAGRVVLHPDGHVIGFVLP